MPKFRSVPKLGTTGAGLEIKGRINEKLGLRVNLSGLPEVNMGSIGDCEPCYEHRLSPFFLGAYLDYHPLGGGFNLSAGVGYNGSRVGLDADIDAGSWYQIGNNVYSATQVGDIHGKARFNDIDSPMWAWDTTGVWAAIPIGAWIWTWECFISAGPGWIWIRTIRRL